MDSARITPNLVESGLTVENPLSGGKPLEDILSSMHMEIQSEDAEELVIAIITLVGISPCQTSSVEKLCCNTKCYNIRSYEWAECIS